MVETYNRYLDRTPFDTEPRLELPAAPALPCRPDPELLVELQRLTVMRG